MAADISNRTYTFTISGGEAEHIPGGIVIRGATLSRQKREYRHTNPSKVRVQSKKPITLKDWKL